LIGVTGTESKVLERLEARERQDGPLPKPLELYRRLLCIQSKAKSRINVPGPGLDSETISNRTRAGQPLLAFDDLSIDWLLVRDMLQEVAALLSVHLEVPAEVPVDLKDSSSSVAYLKEVTRIWFEGAQLPPSIAVSATDETFWEFMIPAALRPFLTSHREALLGSVNQESWRRGYCPICGGSPDFAYLDKERGARWLLCSQCDAEWLFQRIGCPYCGTQSQDDLAYFTDDKGLYRLYVCEQCRHYLKAIDLRHTQGEVLLPLERWLTLDIDAQAQRDGYSPGTKTRDLKR
jgi:FdhE protein